MPQEIKPLTITNFGGPLTRRRTGDINSGLARFDTSWGYDPFSKPGSLTWLEQPSSILTTSSLISALVTMKKNFVGLVPNAYVVDGDGTLRRVNGNTNVVSTLGALTNGLSPASGPGMVFFGTTERIFVGDSNRIQKINVDGSSPSVLGTSSVTAAVPRPMAVFLGKIYFGNGNNIGEIDTTETVITGAKLSPAFPTNTFVRDIKISPEGNYLTMIVTKNNPGGGYIDPLSTHANITESYKFLWNGVDAGATAVESFSGIGLTASEPKGNKDYIVGYDQLGMAIFEGNEKILTLTDANAPFPEGVFSLGNTLGIFTREYSNSSIMVGGLYSFGKYDEDTQKGLYRLLRLSALVRTNIVTTQSALNMANTVRGTSFQSSVLSKVYLLTTEGSVDDEESYLSKMWRFTPVSTNTSSIVAGTYETQTQLFSKKTAVKEVRLYTEPLIANNDFTIDLIGSGGSVMANGSRNFGTVGGSSVLLGTDMINWNPGIAPTYALGVRITNASVTGSANWTAKKLEVDTVPGGK